MNAVFIKKSDVSRTAPAPHLELVNFVAADTAKFARKANRFKSSFLNLRCKSKCGSDLSSNDQYGYLSLTCVSWRPTDNQNKQSKSFPYPGHSVTVGRKIAALIRDKSDKVDL